MIEVAISDNGTGIIDAQRIFDPFYTTKQVGKGTGLGLSICYGIVRAHGGEIQCWNNEAGAGSTFVVRIPVATEAALAAAASKEAGR
jgi:two-component system NtrC family sensor kinase